MKLFLLTAPGTSFTHVCTAGHQSRLPVSGVVSQLRAGLSSRAQLTISTGYNTEKLWKETLPLCYWNFITPDQSDNLKDMDQVIYVTKKKKKFGDNTR